MKALANTEIDESLKDAKIPRKRYVLPSPKQILDFASGPATWESLREFVMEHGYFRRHRKLVKIKGEEFHMWKSLRSEIWSSGPARIEHVGTRLDKKNPHEIAEDFNSWKLIWGDISAAARLYSGVRECSTPPEFDLGGVSFLCGGREGDDFYVPFTRGITSRDTDIRKAAREAFREDFPEKLRGKRRKEALHALAAGLIAERLSENPPRLSFSREGLSIVEEREETLLGHIWRCFERLFSGEMEAKQCLQCGEWEIKGEGFTRDTWKRHPNCANLARVRAWTSKVRGEDFL